MHIVILVLCAHAILVIPQLLLDYLPLERAKWDDALKRKRELYAEFIQELIVDTHTLAKSAGAGAVDPLGMSWSQRIVRGRVAVYVLYCYCIVLYVCNRQCFCWPPPGTGALASDPLGALGGESDKSESSGYSKQPSAWYAHCTCHTRRRPLHRPLQ